MLKAAAYIASTTTTAEAEAPLTSPVMTYTAGKLTGIAYADGSTKALSYTGDQLAQIDLLRGGVTTRKVFAYAGSVLSSVTETTL